MVHITRSSSSSPRVIPCPFLLFPTSSSWNPLPTACTPPGKRSPVAQQRVLERCHKSSVRRHFSLCPLPSPGVCPVTPEVPRLSSRNTLPLGSPQLLGPTLRPTLDMCFTKVPPLPEAVRRFGSGHFMFINIHPSHGFGVCGGGGGKANEAANWLPLCPLSEIGFHGSRGELLGWGGRVLSAHWLTVTACVLAGMGAFHRLF